MRWPLHRCAQIRLMPSRPETILPLVIRNEILHRCDIRSGGPGERRSLFTTDLRCWPVAVWYANAAIVFGTGLHPSAASRTNLSFPGPLQAANLFVESVLGCLMYSHVHCVASDALASTFAHLRLPGTRG